MTVHELTGEITIHTVTDLTPPLVATLDTADGLEVSLGGVTEMDTAGLQLLLLLRREALARGVPFRLCEPSEPVLRVVELAGRTALFGGADELTTAAHEPAGREAS